MDRLLFLPVAFMLVLVAQPYDLSYLGFAILVGIAVFLYDCFRGDSEALQSRTGVLFLLIGSISLAIALFLSDKYGVTFDAMDHDQTFPKFIRRLPYYGIAFITTGALVMIRSFLKSKDS